MGSICGRKMVNLSAMAGLRRGTLKQEGQNGGKEMEREREQERLWVAKG